MESPNDVAERDDFGIGLAGCGTVSLELIGISQRPVSGGAERQVVGVQILQGAARLGNDGFCIVLMNSQLWPAWRQSVRQGLGSCRLARRLAGLLQQLGVSLRRRSCWPVNSNAEAYVTHNGAWHPELPWQRLQPVQYRRTAPRKCSGIPSPSIRRSARSTSLAAAAW